jgi:uncharacterized protein (TIGR02391 family)
MPYNITDDQKDLLRWLVKAYRENKIRDELGLSWGSHNYVVRSGCDVTQRGFVAVDSNFDAPDEQGLRLLGPLPALDNLDGELKKRCLPAIAQCNTPTAWDSAVRDAFAVVENRLRLKAGVSSKETGVQLVNRLLGKNGAFAGTLDDNVREGYRSFFVGAFTLFRNNFAHTIVDPEPAEGAELLLLANLLLRRLDSIAGAVASMDATIVRGTTIT